MYVELQYFIALIDILPELEKINQESIKYDIIKIWSDFNKEDYLKIKEQEEILQHDIKALEYFIRDKFTEINLKDIYLLFILELHHKTLIQVQICYL